MFGFGKKSGFNCKCGKKLSNGKRIYSSAMKAMFISCECGKKTKEPTCQGWK